MPQGRRNRYGKSADAYVIAVDLGTSLIKAAVFDTDGRQVAQAWRANEVSRPKPHWCEQDLDSVLSAVYASIRECVTAANLSRNQYVALVLTGQGDGTRLVDRSGKPLRPAIIWQDARAAPLIRSWHSEGRVEEVARLTGTALSGSHQTAQLAWLDQHEPDTLRRAATIFFAKDFLFFHLTGVIGTEQSDSSHTFLNVQTRCFEPRVLEVLGLSHIASKLPPLLNPQEAIARLQPEVAAQLGLVAGLPVVLAPFDVVAEMISVGGSRSGIACSVLGTAGIHQVSVEQVLETDDAITIGDTTYIPGNQALIRFIPNMLAMPNVEYWANLLYADLKRPDGRFPWPELEDRIAKVTPGAEGLLYLPFLSPSGERAPRLLPEAHAQFLGLSLNHQRDHLLRAVYEGIALAAVDSLAHLPTFSSPLRLSGAGARGPLLAQILADMLGHTVDAYDNLSGALRGGLLYALVQFNYYNNLDAAYAAMDVSCTTYQPEGTNHAIYEALRRDYGYRIDHEWQV